MSTPVGHSLAALITGTVINKQNVSFPTCRVLVFYFFSSIAADFDFLVGWYFGNINRYHHQFSHSIAMAVVYGGSVYVTIWLYEKWRASSGVSSKHSLSDVHHLSLKYAILGAAIYLSHLLLDLFTADKSPPLGMLLFWPFSNIYVLAPFTVFPSVQHHSGGSDMVEFLTGILVVHNFFSLLIETAILLPIYGLSRYFKSSCRRLYLRG
ncbi:MAG: hypothetical protein GKR96_07085 [Gammaproteobacteria bacterium]|nr:hypothetical protein [Gammaproteobacteria bacterium]